MYREDIDETYHSRHGAIQEAVHVFIKNGLKEVEKHIETISILEVGLGTGLNALLTCLEAQKSINYCGVEAFPIGNDIVEKLNYPNEINNPAGREVFETIHTTSWEETIDITTDFKLRKIKGEIQEVVFDQTFDLVYFDAFGPNSQGEMWDIEIFKKIFDLMNPKSVFVTYCAKGQVRRDLQEVGFVVERLEGPPGKREMLRGVKKA